jgi:hypothetical protein
LNPEAIAWAKAMYPVTLTVAHGNRTCPWYHGEVGHWSIRIFMENYFYGPFSFVIQYKNRHTAHGREMGFKNTQTLALNTLYELIAELEYGQDWEDRI